MDSYYRLWKAYYDDLVVCLYLLDLHKNNAPMKIFLSNSADRLNRTLTEIEIKLDLSRQELLTRISATGIVK